MSRKTLTVVMLGLPLMVYAAEPGPNAPAASPLQSSNILNPNVSVTGWFQGTAGHPHDPGHEPEPALQMKEVEVSFQAIVDTWARGDFFVGFDSEGDAELEEAYITWFRLPGQLALRTGKFRSYFGPFNRLHGHDTPFATRPLIQRNFLGDDGLAGVGGGLSWQIPNPWLFINTDFEILQPPEIAEVPSFDRAERNDLLYTGRMNSYVDLTEAQNVSFGGSLAHGPSGQELDALGISSSTLYTQLYSLDLTYRWKNPSRAMYRSLKWQNEMLWSKHEIASDNAVQSWGLMSWLSYQFARRWTAGGRYDYSQLPTNDSLHEKGGLLFLTFSPSEFARISLQGSHVRRSDGLDENLGFLRVTFNIGPHGAHPF